MGNIRLYGSTSGYTELAPPAVAPDGVLSLPSGTGTLLTAEGGKVLQVVRATDTTFTTTTSTSFVDATGMTVTITPQRSTSAIIIIANFIFSRDGAADEALYAITDSSNNVISGAENDLIFHNSSTLLRMSTMTIAYATPATTSATTYKLRFKATAGVTAQVNNNRGKTGQMYAIEVSA